VRLPPLRERLEEIPWIVDVALRGARPAPVVSAALIEAVMLRHWPGNVRELIKETSAAAFRAGQGDGRLTPRCLDESAGVAIAPVEASAQAARLRRPALEREVVLRMLAREGGNVARSARALGVNRTAFRRWLEQNGVDPKQFLR
jgi:DNA-binding NtrC family response regulator